MAGAPDTAQRAIAFRRVTHADLPLVHGWMQQEYVRRWFEEGMWPYGRFAAEYGRYVDRLEATDPYLALLDGEPFGYISAYDATEWDELLQVLPVEEGTWGTDLLVGRPDLLYRGLGTRMLRTFLARVIFADPAVHTCLIDPSVANHAAIRAYEKAGFRHHRTALVPGTAEESYLMLLTRAEWEAGGGPAYSAAAP